MIRWTIFGTEEIIVFSQQFILDGCMVRLLEGNEEPTINPKDGETGIYTFLFKQARLRLPLDPLLCEVLRRCNMTLCQMSPNWVRVVLGCADLNRILGVRLTYMEIFYCYSLCHCPQDSSWYYFSKTNFCLCRMAFRERVVIMTKKLSERVRERN